MTTKISGANISSIGNTGLNWQAVTVADGSTQVNATSGNGYLLDTNAGVIEVFLPTSPTRGDTIVLADYSGTFATNRVIVNTGGVLIDSSATGDVQLTTNNSIAEFVYIDAAKGWLVKLNQAAGTTPSSALTFGNVYDENTEFISATGGTITTTGDYKIHTFTGDGCFVVTDGYGPFAKVDYLVVAGGGGAGTNHGAGGGAGGFRESHSAPVSGCYTASPLATPTGLPLTVGTYPVTVGGGGTGAADPTSGSNSIFSTITSAGGGDGGSNNGPPYHPGSPGGSGGGAKQCGTAGSGNTPPVSPPQGNNGGIGAGAPDAGQGGGGGATAVGVNGSGGNGGNGGAGAGTLINPATGQSGPGPSQYYAGGGGGNSQACGTNGSGGVGGGGPACQSGGTPGTANTGGGGGGSIGNGGKGIVIIRYKYQN